MLLVVSVWTDMSSLFCVTVLGGLESRGVLRKISDMLEIIMKRIDTLSKMSNSSESHRLEELSSALHRCIFTLIITEQQWHSSSQVSLAAFKSRRDNRIYKMNAHKQSRNVLIASYLHVYLCAISAWFNWKCSSSRLEDKLIKSNQELYSIHCIDLIRFLQVCFPRALLLCENLFAYIIVYVMRNSDKTLS